jgi:O-acetyl-ADP-ribose deacetylase (regulator of RNase III)
MEQALFNRIEAIAGDITRMKVDAIVNAANTSLLGGGGVDGAIHRGAGPELLVECRTLGGCPTGEARITKGYKLPVRFVIHTVGPVYRGRPGDAKLLAACYSNSLKLAAAYFIETIAFPAVSCGVYGYPLAAACGIAIDTTMGFLATHDLPAKVMFIQFSPESLKIYQDYLAAISMAI